MDTGTSYHGASKTSIVHTPCFGTFHLGRGQEPWTMIFPHIPTVCLPRCVLFHIPLCAPELQHQGPRHQSPGPVGVKSVKSVKSVEHPFASGHRNSLCWDHWELLPTTGSPAPSAVKHSAPLKCPLQPARWVDLGRLGDVETSLLP